MAYRIYLVLFFVITSFTSCGQHLYEGLYERRGTLEYFEIKSDSTFKYFSKKGSDNLYSSGNWLKSRGKNNILLLNSSYQKDSFPLFVSIDNNLEISHFEIRVDNFYTREKDTSIWMILVINDTTMIEVVSDIIKIPNNVNSIKSIQLIFCYNVFFKFDLSPVDEYTKKLKTRKFIINNPKAKRFNLSYPAVDVNMFNYKYFNNEKIIIKRKKLSLLAEKSFFVKKIT